MKTIYDFTEGCKPGGSAKQINFILIHPSCVVCRDKYSYIKLFTPGTDSRTADGGICIRIAITGICSCWKRRLPDVL